MVRTVKLPKYKSIVILKITIQLRIRFLSDRFEKK